MARQFGRLPQIGVTSYNGYSFNETVETVNYELRALYDGARRTVWACEFNLTLKWTIGDSSGTDSEAAVIQNKLMRAGGVLKYRGRGFATPDVNQGGVRDVDWGPRPVNLRFVPSGAGRTTDVFWTVQFTLPTCGDATYTGIREFNFALDFDIDRAGYTTRTYRATVKIAQTRRSVDDRRVVVSADSYYEEILPALVPGFRRESVRRSVSEDRNALTLTAVDMQLPPNVPPVGLIEGSVEHTYSSKPGTYFYQWNGQFTASYEIARIDGRIETAVDDFLNLTSYRIAVARGMRRAIAPPGVAVAPGGGSVGGAIGRHAIVPIAFSVTEPDVRGRTQARFSMTYFIAGVDITEILRAGGLWKPWTDDPKVWQASLRNVFAPRGHAKLEFRPFADDKIVDLCEPVKPQTPLAVELRNNQGGNGLRDIGLIIQKAAKVFPAPTPAGSWLAYENFVTLAADTGRVVASTLPSKPLAETAELRSGGAWNPYGNMPAASGSNSPFPPLGNLLTTQQTGGGETFVHQRTKPTLRLVMHGAALRTGYPVPMPELTAINGKKPVLIGEPQFTQGIVGAAMYPVHDANWWFEYLFTDEEGIPTGAIPSPPNPFLAG